VFGIAGVVAVLVGVLSMAQGFRHALVASGSPDVAIVLRSGADTEMMSFLLNDDTHVIANAPGVALSDKEGPLASAELLVIQNIPKRSTGTDANVPLRGVKQAAFAVRDRLQIIEGRQFQSGRNEVIVGRAAASEFAGLNLGDKLQVARAEWTVVGIFAEQGGISESELWTDAGMLQDAYRRGNSYQAMYVKLESEGAFDAFEAALKADPRLTIKVVRQPDYYAKQSTMLFNIINSLGFLVAGLMGVGAVFGALNTMYSAVASRTREIATLRALGFHSGPVIVSILLESLFLALAGGSIGGGLAYVAFDGYQTATINWQSFSQVAFSFIVSPRLLVQGILYAAMIGLIGGFFPALRAARMPVAAALRSL
jgi:putative ABC transport system permease protein